MEEANCGLNCLNGDVLLPPRKRLLAGLKKQSCDCDYPWTSPFAVSSDFRTRLHDLLSADLRNSHLSPEEIVDASRSAALAAAQVAAAARAAAEEKAAVAAKAAAAAKSALELVASVSERTTYKEICQRRNKYKKHVTVKLLYNKHKSTENCETDEELAHRLHRAMNSSPRISKTCVNSDRKNHKNEKHRSSGVLDKALNGCVVLERIPSSTCSRNAEAAYVEIGGSILKAQNIGKEDEDTSECSRANCSEMDVFPAVSEEGTGHSKEKYHLEKGDAGLTSRKRRKIKRKKLSLSLCAIKDRENCKNEPESKGFLLMEDPKSKKTAENVPLLAVASSTDDDLSVKTTSAWKCKEFQPLHSSTEKENMQSLL